MWIVLVVLRPLQTSAPILAFFLVLLLASQHRYRVVVGDGGVDHNCVLVPPERFDAILVKAA